MPSPEAHELALLLVRKAEGDESILDRLLDDHDVPDDVLGFHVQQAVEKRLKAVLALNEVDYERQVQPPQAEADQADEQETSAAPPHEGHR